MRAMRNRRVLHVGWGHPPVLGGGPIFYLHHLCLHQASQGMEPLCFVASQSRNGGGEGRPRICERVHDTVRYHCVEDRPVHYFDWEAPARETDNPDVTALFAETLTLTRPDIVHIHNLVGLSMSLPEVAKAFGCPTVFSVHNYWMLCPRDDLFAPNEEPCIGPRDGAPCGPCVGNPSRVGDFMERTSRARQVLSRHVDLVLAVSGRVREILLDFGIPDARILVQKIGSSAAENNWLTMGSRKVKTASGDEPRRFGYFGTMMSRKGPHVLLEALSHLDSMGSDFRVAFYGAGLSREYGTRLERLLARIPRAAETVRFMGGYTQQDMPALLKDIDVAVIPPLWEDNGPQTVMEALGAGVPVVGARIGGIPDFVRDGVNGLLFEPGNAEALGATMRRLLEERHLLDTLKSGITRPLTMREHAAALSSVYGSL